MAESNMADPGAGDAPPKLPEYGPLTHLLTLFFRLLQLLSPATWLLKTRAATQAKFQTGNPRALTVRRSCLIDVYILAWLAIEGALVTTVTVWSSASPRWWVTCFATWRLIDIFQTSMNVTVFDRLRMKSGPHYIASAERIAILSLWNYGESIVCFGALYANHHASLARTVANAKIDLLDPFYFSAITQLTIGYGDVAPLGGLRAVASAQGLLGFVLGVFAIARVLAFLPKAQSIVGKD